MTIKEASIITDIGYENAKAIKNKVNKEEEKDPAQPVSIIVHSQCLRKIESHDQQMKRKEAVITEEAAPAEIPESAAIKDPKEIG